MISLRNNKLNLEKVFREHIWGNSCFLYKVNFKYTCIMATTNFKGQPVKLIGEFIQVGKVAPDFELVKTDLSSFSLVWIPAYVQLLYVSLIKWLPD